MKRENVNYLVVGVFVLVLMAFMVIVMYKITVPTADTAKYYVRYSIITGIKLGSAVSYGGFQVGQVSDIKREHCDLVGDAAKVSECEKIKKGKGATAFLVEISIKSEYKIPNKSVARIFMPNLLSTQQIDIQEYPSEGYLKHGDVLKEQEEISFTKMLDDVSHEVKTISTANVKPLLESLRLHIDRIGGKLADQIPQIAENTNKLLVTLNKSADSVHKIVGAENQQSVRNILVNADIMTKKLADTASKLDELRQKLNKIIESTDKIVDGNRQDVRMTVVALRRSVEAISSRINSIVYNVEQTSRNFSEFSNKIRQNPGVIIGGKPPPEQGVYPR